LREAMSARPGRGSRALALAVVAAAVVAAFVVAASVGPSPLGLRGVLDVLAGGGDASARAIVLDFRLTRILLAACVGAALSVAGASYQAVLRNTLADPFILGVSGGAALGAVVFIAAAPGTHLGDALSLPAAAFLGALATLLVLFGLGRFRS